MTREEHIEEIAFDIECLNMFRQIKSKHRNTRIGMNADETCVLLKERIKRQTAYHFKTYNERVSVILLESLL